jgi:hypothetical protein
MQQQDSEPGGGHPVDIFTTPPRDDLTCSICFDVFRDPVQVCAFQHTYCRWCIAQAKVTNAKCPMCRGPLVAEEPAEAKRDEILQLPVHCLHAGCEWTGPFAYYEAHKAECPFEEVPCPFADAGCAFRAARGEMAAHSGDAAAHFLMLTSNFASAKAECATVKAENGDMKININSLQRYVSTLQASGEEAAASRMVWVSSRIIPAVNGQPVSTYTGQMREGKFHGFGRVSFAPSFSFSYDGQWKEHKMHGHGIRKFPNGNSYDGEWQENKQHGQGVYKYISGDSYDGQWEGDKQHGQGIYQWSGRGTEEGLWVLNKRQGLFIYTKVGVSQ